MTTLIERIEDAASVERLEDLRRLDQRVARTEEMLRRLRIRRSNLFMRVQKDRIDREARRHSKSEMGNGKSAIRPDQGCEEQMEPERFDGLS